MMPKILLVEDDNLTRTILGQFLRTQGYQIEVTTDGTQALLLLQEHKFDLVVADVVMPNMNGWELADHIGSIAPEMPVLLLTAYAAVQAKSRQAPAHPGPEVILKPLVLTDLLAKIQTLLLQKKT